MPGKKSIWSIPLHTNKTYMSLHTDYEYINISEFNWGGSEVWKESTILTRQVSLSALLHSLASTSDLILLEHWCIYLSKPFRQVSSVTLYATGLYLDIQELTNPPSRQVMPQVNPFSNYKRGTFSLTVAKLKRP